MLLFRVKKGKDNYAKCDGCYKPDPKGRHLNGHLVYQNEGQHRFLAKTDDAWVIGPVQDLEGHLQEHRNLAFLCIFVFFFPGAALCMLHHAFALGLYSFCKWQSENLRKNFWRVSFCYQSERWMGVLHHFQT